MKVPILSELKLRGESTEYLFWIGCAGSFDVRSKKVTKAFVKILNKAPNRPIHNQLDRQLVVAGLGCVDGVILFNEPTPIHCIESILPDVLVKGGDYDAKEENTENPKFIVGSTLIKKSGGTVITIDLVPGHSTTAILGK